MNSAELLNHQKEFRGKLKKRKLLFSQLTQVTLGVFRNFVCV